MGEVTRCTKLILALAVVVVLALIGGQFVNRSGYRIGLH
jgi:hypothetical protein